MEAKDILLDDNLDLIIENGDFKVGLSDQQHALLIINSFIGEFKSSPLMGVGISDYISSSGLEGTLQNSIKTNLLADGFTVNGVIVNGNLNDYQYYLDIERK